MSNPILEIDRAPIIDRLRGIAATATLHQPVTVDEADLREVIAIADDANKITARLFTALVQLEYLKSVTVNHDTRHAPDAISKTPLATPPGPSPAPTPIAVQLTNEIIDFMFQTWLIPPGSTPTGKQESHIASMVQKAITAAVADATGSLLKDKERLDWLGATSFDLAENNGKWYLAGSPDPNINGVEHPTIREAIDAAANAKR